MNGIWIAAVAALAFAAGVFASGWYERKKRNRILHMLEQFRQGKTEECPDLNEGMDSRTAFLLNEIRLEILCTSKKEQTENNQVKGMISDISHQLRTPLTNIRMYGELLEESGKVNGEEHLYVENICSETLKCEWLMKNLVNASRLETDAISPIIKEDFLKETLMEAIREVGHLSRQKRIEIVLEEFPDVLVLQSRRWTREVFVNLLENALKYSPSGSAIRITVQPQVSYVAVSVKDRGIGIPKEDQRKIFKRFYRCENVQNEIGSGLGLYLVQLILLKESGNISVKSEVGKGSTFTVFLKMVNVEKESISSYAKPNSRNF